MTRGSHPYDVAALRRAHPIASIISGYGIALHASGHALVGRCPFHPDHGRPNLHVYPDSQRWYCYRCHVGGDIIDFIQRLENLGFSAACQRVTGLPTEPNRGNPRPRPTSRRWDRLRLDEQVVMNLALEIYQEALWRMPQALAYLQRRGISETIIRDCRLGYADGTSLVGHLRRLRVLRIAQDLGLLHRSPRRDRSSRLVEFFSGRIVVPELRGGHCIWLIGRALDDNPSRPKYLTLTGERPVLGVERTVGHREVFLCEGVFDYLTAVGWELPACSPCGTSLPAERLGFLARADVVYGVFDADTAGQAASERFAARLDSRWQPIALPDGCDLNDLGRRADGRATFFRLLAATRPSIYTKGEHDV
jgi:DNA primase